jgi:Rps23 Pro-64 3,4-dihydroxylase Tpa1-like proline 4-hydroxylase
MGGGYIEYEGKLFQQGALKELRPDLFHIKPDMANEVSTDFGTQFPRMARKGQIFVRVDVLPNRVFKFDGKKWLEQNKTTSQSYLYNKEYIEFLIERIRTGEYDIDVLSDNERAEIEAHLNGNQNS